MTDGELKFPEWQGPLQDLMLETDREKLLEGLQNVETLILQRLQQIRHQPDGRVELDALNHALRVLRTIKADKLDFPDWQ